MTTRTHAFPRPAALALCSLLGLFAVIGCAGAQPAAASAFRCSLARSYSDRQVAILQRMRDDGDGLSQVAQVLGGTRADIRCAEKALRMARSQTRRALTAALDGSGQVARRW
jgi:hypothetical protein